MEKFNERISRRIMDSKRKIKKSGSENRPREKIPEVKTWEQC